MDGRFQEYSVIPENNVVKIPDNLEDVRAAVNEPVGFSVNAMNLSRM